MLFASKNGHAEVVEALVAAGADREAKAKASRYEEKTGNTGTVPTAYFTYLHVISQEYRYLFAHHERKTSEFVSTQTDLASL